MPNAVKDADAMLLSVHNKFEDSAWVLLCMCNASSGCNNVSCLFLRYETQETSLVASPVSSSIEKWPYRSVLKKSIRWCSEGRNSLFWGFVKHSFPPYLPPCVRKCRKIVFFYPLCLRANMNKHQKVCSIAWPVGYFIQPHNCPICWFISLFFY